MGFFQEITKPENLALMAASPAAGIGRAAFYNNPAGAQGTTDPSNKYTPYSGSTANNYGLGTDIVSPGNYEGIVNKAFEGLGQPGGGAPGRDQITQDFVRGLTSSFVDNYHKKTGQLPTTDQIKQFVAQNADTSTAKQFVTGQLNQDQIDSLSNSYIQGNPDLQPKTAPTNLGATSDQINALYDPLQANAVAQVKQQFDPLRARAVDEEAALGRLRSGVSAAPGSAISQVDANQGNALSSVIGNILGQKATGTLDLTKFNQNLDLAKQNAATANNQFNQNLSLNKQAYSDQQNLANKQLSLSELLGKQQAAGKQKDWLDYLNAGVNAAGTGAKIAAMF